jgi:hypothetical protein
MSMRTFIVFVYVNNLTTVYFVPADTKKAAADKIMLLCPHSFVMTIGVLDTHRKTDTIQGPFNITFSKSENVPVPVVEW